MVLLVVLGGTSSGGFGPLVVVPLVMGGAMVGGVAGPGGGVAGVLMVGLRATLVGVVLVLGFLMVGVLMVRAFLTVGLPVVFGIALAIGILPRGVVPLASRGLLARRLTGMMLSGSRLIVISGTGM